MDTGFLWNAGIRFFSENPVSIVSAEKRMVRWKIWCQRGYIYHTTEDKNNISIKSLKAEGHMIPFTQNIAGKIIVVQGNFQYKNNNDATVEDMPAGASTEKRKQNVGLQESWIEYTVKTPIHLIESVFRSLLR